MTSPHNARSDGRRPQLRSVPNYKTSAGQEAIRLAASCGLFLDPWQCDTLIDCLGEREDGKWAAFEVAAIVGRQNGKGSLLEARVLAGLLLFGEQLVMWTAHELKTAYEAFRRCVALIENSEELKRRVKPNGIIRGNGKEGIEFRNGARIRFVARSKGSGRGFSGDCVVLDEAYALTAEELEALMPTMSARPNPQIYYTSSPPLASDTGDVLFKLRDRAKAGDSSLAYFDWGEQGVDLSSLHDVDLDDRAVWARTNPAWGIRISEEFTAKERASMTDEGFARERLGIWPARHAGASIIDLALWAGLKDEQSKSKVDRTKVAFALDVTPTRDFATIGLYALREDGLGHLQVVDRMPGTDWVAPRLAALRQRWNPIAIGLDARSPAFSLVQELAKHGITEPSDVDSPKFGDLAITDASKMAQACGQFVDDVNRKALRHLGQAPLEAAVANAKVRPMLDAWAWGRKVSNVDISPLVATTLARWAFHTRVDVVTADYDVLQSIW